MAVYRLDKTKFNARSAATASGDAAFYRKLSWQERLIISNYLNSKAFNYDVKNPPKMDRTAFKVRSRQ